MSKLIRNKMLVGALLYCKMASHQFNEKGEAIVPDDVADALVKLKGYEIVEEHNSDANETVTEVIEPVEVNAGEDPKEEPAEDSLKAPAYTREDLEPKTVKELESIIDELNLPVKKSLKRAEMLEAILKAL